MDIVILSGKGGTGKTTVSTNLAAVAGRDAALLDCDVEEPDGHLFVKEDIVRDITVHTSYPVIDEEKCTHCGKCAEFCFYNALLSTKKINIVMPELCHDCGGCAIICPVNAISFTAREIGRVGRVDMGEGQPFVDGIINTGEYAADRVIERVLDEVVGTEHRIIDAPPGCACMAVKAAENADFALVVTEPTPFALSDMKMVVEMLEMLSVPAGVFINKSGENEENLLAYCREKKLIIMGKLPYSPDYGKTSVEGDLIVKHHKEAEVLFRDLWSNLLQRNGK